ncbi:MAG: hypothetical protein KJS97_04390 [Alphaproteobacteria bacterium]|nr:hypothetical protein [Alphaproteobacteria bacterium]
MQTMRKFAFDTVFSPTGEVLRDASGTRNVFTAEEVEAERQAAYEAGRTDETARQLALVSAQLETVTNGLRQLYADYAGNVLRIRDGAAEMAMAAARAIAGDALAAHGDARIRALLEEVFAEALTAPRLMVKVEPAARERLRPQVEALAEEFGFSGALHVRDDADLGPGDVVVDWGEGLVALRAADAAAEIETRVRAMLSATEASERITA